MHYFNPLRRKIGVITLVLACLFAGFWARSHSIEDIFCTGSGNASSYHELISSHDAIFWSWAELVEGNYIYTPGWAIYGYSQGQPLDPIERYANPVIIEKRWQWLGFDLGRLHDAGDPSEKTVWLLVPYRFIVIPLTLLSAGLLLSSPRKFNQATRDAPLPEKVV